MSAKYQKYKDTIAAYQNSHKDQIKQKMSTYYENNKEDLKRNRRERYAAKKARRLASGQPASALQIPRAPPNSPEESSILNSV